MSLAEVVRNLGRPKILVVGDLVLDRYVFGTVSRISPEAPIPVLKAEEEEFRLGCAGSAARNLQVLGAEVFLAGYVGQGEYAENLLALCEELELDITGVHRVEDRPTFRKTRLIATIAGKGVGGQQILRVDREDLWPFKPDDEAKLTVAALSVVSKVDLVVLSDYAKGTLTTPLIRAVIDAAREHGIPVLVDPKPPEYERYRGATAITPNRVEAQAHVGYEIDDLEKARTAGEQIRKDLDLEAVLVTLDKDGIYVSTDAGGEGSYPIVPREIFDVTGAGDIVIAVLAMAMAAGTGYADAVRIANVASGIAIGKLGVVSVSRQEILEALHEAGRTRSGRKRLPIEDLVEVLEARRQRGEKVVFTNGCFDVLHAGHIRLLTAARAEGDALVVGLNSDASIRRLKGEERPVREEGDRVQVLSELESVDHIIVFEGDTPLPEIEAIKPDVLVKGEDWRDKGVVGQEVVEANGGRVFLVTLIPGLSSTRLIEKMRESEK